MTSEEANVSTSTLFSLWRAAKRWIVLCIIIASLIIPTSGSTAQSVIQGAVNLPAPNRLNKPGYSPRFTPLTTPLKGHWDDAFGSPGMNNVVRALHINEYGELVAAGDFTYGGGILVNGITYLDGPSWQQFGTGFNKGVYALAEDWNKNLFAGGNFTKAGVADVKRVAKWDGGSWTPLGSGIEGDVVRALVFDGNGNLYAGGRFSSAGGVSVSNIAKWNGSTWSAVGTGVTGGNGIIYDLEVDGSNLYAAGSFNNASGDTIYNVAKWNGSHWLALGSGTNGTNSDVYELEIVDGILYAAGAFTQAGGVTANYIAKWDGSSWSPVGSGMNSSVTSLAYDGDLLFAGGVFTKAGGVNANRIAAWDGSSWSPLEDGTNSGVSTLVVKRPGELIVGGYFTQAGGYNSSRIARWSNPVVYLPLTLGNPGGDIPATNPPPAPPSNLTAIPISRSEIQLEWKDNSNNETEFIIENSPDGVNFAYYGTSEIPDVELMWDIELGSGTTHCYRVFARNAHGDSNPSNTACATTDSDGPPTPISNLTAQVVHSNRILLTWTNNSSCEGYKVYESVDGGPHNFVGVVTEGNLPGAYVTGLPAGDTYSYRVVPFNSYGDSSYDDSPISNTVDPPAVTSNTITRFFNNTVYPVISLQVDGIEQFPTQPMGIPPGGYYQMELAVGSHNYRAANGFWSGGSRTEMYIYQGPFNQQNNITAQIPFNNPTIAQILTRFGSSGYYTGDYWTGTLPNSAAFRFYNNGSYTFYRNGVAQGSGNYSMVSYPGNFMLTFQVTGYQNAQGRMDERSSSFYMSNGPADWPTIQYTYDGY
jgi:hypothetical protein